MTNLYLAGMVVVGFGLMVGAFTKVVVTLATPPTVTSPIITKITLQQFNQIKQGMNISQVQQVMGRAGKLLVTNANNRVYIWQNPDGSNAVIEFKSNQVADKLQSGLPQS